MTDQEPGAQEPGTGDLSEFAGRWKLDSAGSTVAFRSTALWGLVKVKGTFATLSGEGSVDGDGTVTGRLAIDASSVDTGNKKRDDHLRSADFFDVVEHPSITFALEQAHPTPDGLHLHGNIQVAGSDQPVELAAAVVDQDGDSVTLTTDVTFDRSLWGLDLKKNGMSNMATPLHVVARFVREQEPAAE